MLVEHARNLGGIRDASHAEYGASGTPVITPLACSLNGQEITVELMLDSLLARLHGAAQSTEFTTCNYGLALDAQHLAGEHGMSVSAIDDTGEVRAIERTDHPFFMGTLYQPQLRSKPGQPHPVFVGLLKVRSPTARCVAATFQSSMTE